MAATAANTIDMETSPMIMSMWLSFLGSGWGGGGRVDGFGTVGGGNLYENLELHESSKNECNGYRDTKSSFLYCEVLEIKNFLIS